jgi:hypothetical protein
VLQITGIRAEGGSSAPAGTRSRRAAQPQPGSEGAATEAPAQA